MFANNGERRARRHEGRDPARSCSIPRRASWPHLSAIHPRACCASRSCAASTWPAPSTRRTWPALTRSRTAAHRRTSASVRSARRRVQLLPARPPAPGPIADAGSGRARVPDHHRGDGDLQRQRVAHTVDGAMNFDPNDPLEVRLDLRPTRSPSPRNSRALIDRSGSAADVRKHERADAAGADPGARAALRPRGTRQMAVYLISISPEYCVLK